MAAVSGVLISGSAMASGSLGSGSSFPDRPIKQVDPFYEHGKALVKGRVRDYGKIRYCLRAPNSDDGRKLGGRSAKQYREDTAQNLALALYNCDVPEQNIADVLQRDDLLAVLHYLNVRYKLNLSS